MPTDPNSAQISISVLWKYPAAGLLYNDFESTFCPDFLHDLLNAYKKKEEPRFSPWWKMDMLRIYLFSYLMRKSFADFPEKAKREPFFSIMAKGPLGILEVMLT